MPSAKRAFSFLSSYFTNNSYFEIKLVFTPVKEKSFFFFLYQSQQASLGQSQGSQSSWQYLIKPTPSLLPPASQRCCRWGTHIILEVLEFCRVFTFPLECLGKFTNKFLESSKRRQEEDTYRSFRYHLCLY